MFSCILSSFVAIPVGSKNLVALRLSGIFCNLSLRFEVFSRALFMFPSLYNPPSAELFMIREQDNLMELRELL